MNMKKWMYLLVTALVLTGCASLGYSTDRKMKDIELGMSKKKVISILGKHYDIAGARMTPEGSIESISYRTVTIADSSEGYYILSFKDGKLVEWFKQKQPINNDIHRH